MNRDFPPECCAGAPGVGNEPVLDHRQPATPLRQANDAPG